MNTFKALLLEEDGQGMVEYILIIAVVALVVVGAIKMFGSKLRDLFIEKGDEMIEEAN